MSCTLIIVFQSTLKKCCRTNDYIDIEKSSKVVVCGMELIVDGRTHIFENIFSTFCI